MAHHCSASTQHQPDLCHFLCRCFDSDLSRAASLFSRLLKQAHLVYRDRTKSVTLESCGERHALLVSCPKQGEEVWFDLALLWWAEHYLDWTGQAFRGFHYWIYFFLLSSRACRGTVSSVQPGSAAGLERSQQFPLCSDAGRAAPFHTNITC